ncbi:hypothetical protein DPMN_156832 [Dreissena polymorpha]|uniref:Uncharacterized protein n=1 Tax=Dreissena polymorpha TaxID=45954 RepID=A0A9D4FUZ6_DREPO|nr:hypothetical protein DPMN_156832 [Dreissena polymorpha]
MLASNPLFIRGPSLTHSYLSSLLVDHTRLYHLVPFTSSPNILNHTFLVGDHLNRYTVIPSVFGDHFGRYPVILFSLRDKPGRFPVISSLASGITSDATI